MKKIVLACESSCDETAWCLYDAASKKVISHTLHTQIAQHEKFGGVVPEVASSQHLKYIDQLLEINLKDVGIALKEVDFFAATTTPGLPGSLLIGAAYTKAIAWANQKPFIPVNHLAGHIYSVLIENEVEYPYLCLSASGGHTALYIVYSDQKYEFLANTRDDAAGELFDKVAKLMNIGYPGGPIIEQRAKEIGFIDARKYPRLKYGGFDFSFSGIKTAVLYDLVDSGYYSLQSRSLIKEIPLDFIQQVSSSLLVAVSDIFINRIKAVHKKFPEIKAIGFVGGVACNKYITGVIKKYCELKALSFYAPSRAYCTDNAAMIAVVAASKINNDWSYFADINE